MTDFVENDGTIRKWNMLCETIFSKCTLFLFFTSDLRTGLIFLTPKNNSNINKNTPGWKHKN